jgi:crossover junction endodeoxyribonuclease RuvC
MTTPRLLALDLSLTHTGVCDHSGGTSCLVMNARRGMERLDTIARRVQSLARGVELVVIEGPSYASKGSSLFQIAGLNEVVRFMLYRMGVPYVDVPPGTLKKWATGSGAAKKVDMVVTARERYGLCGTTDDNESDAYLLWAMARHAYGEPVREPTKYQTEALGKVNWPRKGASRE